MVYGGGMGARASLPSFFFLREFFSRALLSERLEQATNIIVSVYQGTINKYNDTKDRRVIKQTFPPHPRLKTLF